jgi:Transcription factor WhiB
VSRATMGGTGIVTKPTRNVAGGMAGVSLARTDQLLGRIRPAWADDPAVVLPCQRPDVDPDWWFETGVSPANRAIREHAIRLCGRCPMREPCRETAAENHEGWGIWGGEMREPLNRPGSAARRKGATA